MKFINFLEKIEDDIKAGGVGVKLSTCCLIRGKKWMKQKLREFG